MCSVDSAVQELKQDLTQPKLASHPFFRLYALADDHAMQCAAFMSRLVVKPEHVCESTLVRAEERVPWGVTDSHTRQVCYNAVKTLPLSYGDLVFTPRSSDGRFQGSSGVVMLHCLAQERGTGCVFPPHFLHAGAFMLGMHVRRGCNMAGQMFFVSRGTLTYNSKKRQAGKFTSRPSER
eukprot:811012-Amphidinium_carterae.2